LHHRGEHSIELALVWLQHIRGDKPCPILPVLCGSFHHFMTGQADIAEETRYKTFVNMLRQEMAQRRTVVVAAGDLAHLGPVFDTPPLNPKTREQMETDDTTLMNVLCNGDAAAFFDFMKTGQYERNVCGLSSFYFTLDILEKSQGQTIAYDCCLADNDETSYVSVCGIVLHPTDTE
jgi:AmmeMemoRadiSam system protein B